MDSNLYQYLLDGQALMGFPSMSVHWAEIEPSSTLKLTSETTLSKKDIYKVGSLSKLVTAIAVLMLAEKQRLQLNNAVALYLPYLEQTQWHQSRSTQASVYDLLMHSAGLPRGVYLDDAPSQSNIIASLNNGFAQQTQTSDLITKSPQDSATQTAPGLSKYSNLGYILLGQIIESVTQMPFTDFVKQHLFLPLGMVNTGFGTPPQQTAFARPHQLCCFTQNATSPFTSQPMPLLSTPTAAADMHSNTHDMMRLLTCLLARGRWQGKTLLTENSVDFLLTQHRPIGKGVSRGMGLLFARSGLGNLVFEAAEHAGHSAVIFMVPEKGFALVALVNRASAGDSLFHMMNNLARYWLTRNKPTPNTPPLLSHSPRHLRPLAGEFADDKGNILTIRWQENALRGAFNQDSMSRLIAVGQQGLIIEKGRLAKYPWFIPTAQHRMDVINVGPHQFCRSTTKPRPQRCKHHDTKQGIYRNQQFGRIAVYARNGQLFIAFSPWKEALLQPIHDNLYQQVTGPFATESVRFIPASQQVHLSGYSFSKTNEVY